MWTVILTLLAALSAALSLRATYFGPSVQAYVFKPLTMVLIVLIALLARRPVSSRYKYLIIAGLLFSLVGDVLLMLPADLFLPGLVSFLVAHLVYIVAFRSDTEPGFSPWSLIPFAIFGTAMYVLLASGLGGMRLPVVVYIVIILVMAWQAWDRWTRKRRRDALLAFTGAVLFVISDAALAVNRFRVPYEASSLVVWSTYVAAQWLIAISVRKTPPA